MFAVNEESKIKIYGLFERTENMVNDDVKTIKNWMKTQHHLPEIMDDAMIKNFLNLNKFSVEKTKQKIDWYYTIRSLFPDFYENCNPKLENMQKALDVMYINVCPKLVDGIHRIIFLKYKGLNPYWNPEDQTKALFNLLELRLKEDFMFADIIIVDMANVTINDIKLFTPGLISKATMIYQKVFSFRLHAMHFLNSPSYMAILLSILKAVMKPKLFDRIQVHKDDKIMQELYAKENLPKEYGGDGPSLDELNEMLRRKFEDYQGRFDVLDTLKVKEELRPEKLNNDEILGYYGNFKKLDVD